MIGPPGPKGDPGPIGRPGNGDGASSAIAVSFEPFGDISSNNLQAALEEVALEKAHRGSVVDDGVIGQQAATAPDDLANEDGDIILDEGEI